MTLIALENVILAAFKLVADFIRMYPVQAAVFSALYITIHWYLAKLASNYYERFNTWFFSFILLPGISHLIYLSLLLPKMFGAPAPRTPDSLPAHAVGLFRPKSKKRLEDHLDSPVTPFGDTGVPLRSTGVYARTRVLGTRRDRELDKLIEFKLWPKARDEAERKLKKALRKKRSSDIELYSAYVTILKEKNPHFWGPSG